MIQAHLINKAKHDLLEEVWKVYDIPNMIKNLIYNTKLDKSYDDLSQHIYLVLYDQPFSRLYYLFSRGQMPHFITGIIKNHRKSPYLEYNKQFRFKQQSEIEEYYVEEEEPIPDDTLDKLEAINYTLHKKYPIEAISGFSYIQSAEFFSIEIYKLYLKKKLTSQFSFTRLSKELKINRNLISDSIQAAKEIIRDEYKNNKKK